MALPPAEVKGEDDNDEDRKDRKKSKKDKKNKKERRHKKDKKSKKSKHLDHDDLAELEQEVANEDKADKYEQRERQEIYDHEHADISEAEEVDMPEEGGLDCRTESKIAAQIIDEMSACIEDDIESNRNGMPALKKLTYSPTLLRSLKNLKVQECFLDINGCKYLAEWLSKLPDGSFPCLNIIEIGLELCDILPIESEHLLQSNLGKCLVKISKMKGGNEAITRK